MQFKGLFCVRVETVSSCNYRVSFFAYVTLQSMFYGNTIYIVKTMVYRFNPIGKKEIITPLKPI